MLVNPGIRRTLSGVGRVMNSAGFWAKLTKSIVLDRGTGSPTFARATTGTFPDHEGVLRTAIAGEARFVGARRVRNLLSTTTENFSDASWSKVRIVESSGFTDPNGGTSAWGFTHDATGGTTTRGILQAFTYAASGVWVESFYLKAANKSWVAIGTDNVGAKAVWFNLSTGAVGTQSTGYTGTIEAVGNGFYRCSVKIDKATAATSNFFIISSCDGDASFNSTTISTLAFYGWRPQLEEVTGQSVQTAGEYVSVGVLSSPYHGAGVDGVKYFDTTLAGVPISASTVIGELSEGSRTQYLGLTDAPATQTTASLGTGTYTHWVVGAGSSAVSAGTATITGAGSATAGTPVTFTVTVAGTVTVTKTGALTRFQLENGAFPSQYIPNSGAAGTSVVKNADVDSYQTSGNIAAAQGWIYLEYTPQHAPSGTVFLWGTYVDASNYTAILHDGTNLIFRKRIAAVNYDATIANTFVSGTTYKMAATWSSTTTMIALNGTAGTPSGNGTAAQIGTTMQWGADGNGANQPFMCEKNGRIGQAALSSSQLAAITT